MSTEKASIRPSTRIYQAIFCFLRSMKKRIDSHEAFLFLFIAVYTLFFSYITIRRIQALQTYAYDLGNYNQALYTTVTGKGFLYYTADLIANPSGSIFGVHISVDLLLMLPIYALFPAPESLLVIQSLVLALGAFPVYLLARRMLNSKNLAFAFALAYLLSPALQGINWYDFHPESFIILPMLFAAYFSEKREWLRYSISMAFVLFAIDKAAMLVGAFALYKLISLKKDEMPRKGHPVNLSFLVYVATFVVAIGWFIFAAWAVTIFTPFNVFVSGESQIWSSLGARNLTEIPIRVLLSPGSVLNALSFEWVQKLGYIVLLYGGLLFLSALAPKTILMALPWMAVSLLSNYSPYYQFGTQYPAYVFPAVLYGSIVGASKLGNRFKSVPYMWVKNRLFALLLVSSLVLLVVSGPFTAGGVGKYPYINYGFPEIPQQSRFVSDFIKMVPGNASILAQSNLFPLVSNRENAYVTPASVFYPPGTSFLTSLESILGKIDYVLLDLNTDLIDAGILLSQPTIRDKFGLLASADGVILLKRGYVTNPVFFESFKRTYTYRDLLLLDDATTVEDPESLNQIVMFHSGVTNNDFWYGPYVCLPPGKYQAAFRLKIGQQVNGEVTRLRVSSFPSTIWVKPLGNNQTGYHLTFIMNETRTQEEHGSRLVYGEDFTVGEYKEFTIDFNVEAFGVYEFTGLNVRTPVGLYLDEVKVSQIEPDYRYETDLRFLGNE